MIILPRLITSTGNTNAVNKNCCFAACICATGLWYGSNLQPYLVGLFESIKLWRRNLIIDQMD